MYTAEDRRVHKDNLKEGSAGWSVIDGSGKVIEHTAVARVVIVKAERQETIVKPGALLDVMFERRFAEEDPGESILLEYSYDLQAIDSVAINGGFCFMVHEDKPMFFDMAGVGVPGYHWPKYQLHLLPTILSRRDGSMAGEQVSAVEFLRRVEAFDAADVAEAFANQEQILAAVQKGIARELLEAVKAKKATDRFDVLNDLAASDLLPGFVEDHLSAGFVVDLLAEALADSVAEMGFAEMHALADLAGA